MTSSKRRRQMRRKTWPTPIARQPWVHNRSVRAGKDIRRAMRSLDGLTRAFSRLNLAATAARASLAEFAAGAVLPRKDHTND